MPRLAASACRTFPAIRPNEPVKVTLDRHGDSSTLRFYFTNHHDACLELSEIRPSGLSNVVFGDQNVLNSQQIGSISEEVDNLDGVGDVEVNFRDLFAEKETSDSTHSEGGSVKTSIESEQSIEGVASFKESVEVEAHAEISESRGSETDKEDEGSEGTTVPIAKRVRITETRTRADVEVSVTADGKFNHVTKIGHHSGGKVRASRLCQVEHVPRLRGCCRGPSAVQLVAGRQFPQAALARFAKVGS